ncbi:MAG: DUF5714 domain-containing protein [Clostridia bacterium]|nr:DUF5714 domain-containing protein [Clostridia bacterium]MDQ7792312.1 DUF5714 domain-containing protein [Clostridia bacterium]
MVCPKGHFICDRCHGEELFDRIRQLALASPEKDVVALGEMLVSELDLPMLGCEHAWVAAAALMVAIRNEATLAVTDDKVNEAMVRTRRQAIAAFCGLTGVCGISPAIGACFSVLLGASCPRNRETAVTMRITARVTDAMSSNAGPSCCKNFLRVALKEAAALAHEYLYVEIPADTSRVICRDSHRHPHGCRREKCAFFRSEPDSP